MKDIEKLLHDALDKHEMPFDPKAWEQMSARLDGKTPSKFYKKWWIAASVGIVAVSAATFYTLHSNENMPANVQKETPVATSRNFKTPEVSSNTAITQTTNNPSNNTTPITNAPVTYQKQQEHSTMATSEIKEVKHVAQITLPAEITPIQKKNTSITTVAEEHLALVLPDHVCLNDVLLIENPYTTKSLHVTLGNKKTLEIGPKEHMSVDAAEIGDIAVFTGNQLTKTIQVVQPKGKLTLEVDPTLIYNNGIPAIEFNAVGAEKNVTWDCGNVPYTLQKGMLIAHPYASQVVTVKATAIDENGCTLEETSTVRLDERYNLLAPTAFVTNSPDERNKTFMPYALVERNTPFELYIYDPKTGRVIFTSNDVNNPWNGFDKNANEIVPEGSTWLWKVILHKPNAGEPAEYKGTIQRL